MNVEMKSVCGLEETDSFGRFIFQNSMVGYIIVSDDMRVTAANSRMFEYFQMEPCEAGGVQVGRLLNCAECSPSAFCGKSLKCRNCCVRIAVKDALHNHIDIKDSIIQFAYRNENHRRTKWFILSSTVIPQTECVLLTFSDITELKQQEEQLRKRLALDLATGTMNKYSLMESMQKLIEPDAPCRGFTVCMIDFDNFKEINDQCGHLVGDKVLVTFSEIARKHIRKKDILGRYGGEEFMFIFPETNQSQAFRILKRIHNDLRLFFTQYMELPVTFSAGIVNVDHNECDLQNPTDLIGSVDRMLYRAKKRGRNRAVFESGEILFTGSKQ
jgi:diguanylate cyclase (GGDEF)-like protein